MSKLFIGLVFLLTVQQTKVLLIGDSLTANPAGWQSQLCESKDWDCTNLSVKGSKTKGMLQSLKDQLAKDRSFKQVIIYGGINDIFSHVKVDTAISNVQKMINVCQLYKIKPIIIIGYDPNDINHNTWLKNKIEEAVIRDRYIEYQYKLSQLKGVKIVPVASLKKSDSNDGVHLTTDGQTRFYNQIKAYF